MSRWIDPGIVIQILAQLPAEAVMVEIGAHCGTDTLTLKSACPLDTKYFAVEADVRHYALLREVCKRTGAVMLPCAIGAANRVAQLFYLASNSLNITPGSSSLRKPKLHLQEHPWCRFETTTEVEVMTLDTLCMKQGIKKI